MSKDPSQPTSAIPPDDQPTPAVISPETIRVAPLDMEEPKTFDHYLGHTLDQKYRLELLLGKGGMGGVYLSTHLGTGRSVAVKLIMPEFMRTAELVERFKREARAAGRLRHPNIVDVTDFGIASVGSEQIAYLVMEYLDGCTLGDILAEEPRLPLHWVADVMEQTCIAVAAAHKRGIVHRDLKPANIWLEPNTLGGYRVKVLDFGIAKLADEPDAAHASKGERSSTGTVFLEGCKAEGNAQNPAADALTQAGTVLGTPAYMSPEQCRGEPADARSDIYSLGIIAYEMLSGTKPFSGPARSILQAHQELAPTPLTETGANVSPDVSRLIMSALEKDPGKRPASAKAFGLILQASASGIGGLYRRAFALYSEYFPQILKVSLLAHLPVLLVSAITVVLSGAVFSSGKWLPLFVELPLGVLKSAATFVTGSTIAGLIAIIVATLSAAPLRPVRVSSAFRVLIQHWRPFFSTGLMTSLLIVLGYAIFVIPGLILTVRYSLWAPVVLMEGLRNRAARRRSRELAARSRKIAIVAALFQVAVPGLVSFVIQRLLPAGKSANPWLRALASESGTLSSVLVLPLLSIVVALVFLKLRQLGGEDFGELVAHMTEQGGEKKWEKRMLAAETPKRQ